MLTLERAGKDLRRLPIEGRRAKLARLFASRPLHSTLIFSETFEQDGVRSSPMPAQWGLEGMVSKLQGSLHGSGPRADWVKTLNPLHGRPETPDRMQ